MLALLIGGPSEGPAVPLFFGLAWAVVSALLVLDATSVRWSNSAPPILRRPVLGRAAALMYAILAVQLFSPTAIGLLWLVGTVVFVRDSARRGELDPIRPRLLWRSGRIFLVIGAAVLLLSRGAYWHAGSTSTSRSAFGNKYYQTTSQFSGSTLYELGGDQRPALVILAALLSSAWVGAPKRWTRYVPLVCALILFGFGLTSSDALAQRREAFPGRGAYFNSGVSLASGGSVILGEAFGPTIFLLGLIPFGLGALFSCRLPRVPAERTRSDEADVS